MNSKTLYANSRLVGLSIQCRCCRAWCRSDALIVSITIDTSHSPRIQNLTLVSLLLNELIHIITPNTLPSHLLSLSVITMLLPVPTHTLTSSKNPHKLFKLSLKHGCAKQISSNSVYFIPPIIATWTTDISSPPSMPKQVNPRMCDVGLCTIADMWPVVWAVSSARATYSIGMRQCWSSEAGGG